MNGFIEFMEYVYKQGVETFNPYTLLKDSGYTRYEIKYYLDKAHKMRIVKNLYAGNDIFLTSLKKIKTR